MSAPSKLYIVLLHLKDCSFISVRECRKYKIAIVIETSVQMLLVFYFYFDYYI